GDEANGKYVNDFYHDLFADPRFWKDLLGQYGIGPGTAEGVLTIAGQAPASVTTLDLDLMVDSLAGQVTKSDQTVIVILVPTGTPIVDQPAEVGGYHGESAGGIPYIFLPEAASPSPFVRSVLDDLTIAASHELAEVVTDPDTTGRQGWYDDELGHLGEVAD